MSVFGIVDLYSLITHRHDRVSHAVPFTILGQDLVLTHWRYLLPLEIEDEDMIEEYSQSYDGHSAHGKCLRRSVDGLTDKYSWEVISGFTCLIKVFLCVLGFITEKIPAHNLHLDQVETLFTRFVSSPPALRAEGFEAQSMDYRNLQNMMENLNIVIQDMPDMLCTASTSINQSTFQSTKTQQYGDGVQLYMQHFEIMKVNIHITKLYLQSVILERFATNMAGESSMATDIILTNEDVWKAREDICRQLLNILESATVETLETHGTSMVSRYFATFDLNSEFMQDDKMFVIDRHAGCQDSRNRSNASRLR